MTLHPEVLSSRQQHALERLAPILTDSHFYLAGGTALALQLGHRRSIDLDWFTQKALANPLLLARRLRKQGIPFTVSSVAPGTLYGQAWGTRVSLLEYQYPLLRRLISWRGGKVRLASPADLAAMKLAAIAQRGAKKDFVDLYALGLTRASLRQMLRWYQDKYSLSDVAHVLYSLAYFEDADRERMPKMLSQVSWTKIKATLRAWIRDI